MWVGSASALVRAFGSLLSNAATHKEMGRGAGMSELRVFAGIETGSTVRECHSLISERLGLK